MIARPRTSPNLFVGGMPLMSQCSWGDLKIEDHWPYGCWELSFGVVVKPYQRPPLLQAGAVVEARIGSGVRWCGILSQPDWSAGQMIATGLAREGESAIAFNSDLSATTSTPDDAIANAVTRGALHWLRRTSIQATPFVTAGDETVALNYVTALLDAATGALGQRWAVNAQRQVYAAADPTTPSLAVRPDAGELGTSTGIQAGTIYGRYQALDGSYQTVVAGAGGPPEVAVGLLSYGAIDATFAQSVIDGIYARVQPTTSFTNGLEVAADQVHTIGGRRVGVEEVVAGKMVRLLGLRDARGILLPAGAIQPAAAVAATDVVIGTSVWDVAAGTVQVTPVGTDDQSLSGVVSDAGGELL